MHLIQKKSKSDRKTWAVNTSLTLDDFHSVIPNPAITYPCELDTFQKKAVARLERGEYIFVMTLMGLYSRRSTFETGGVALSDGE